MKRRPDPEPALFATDLLTEDTDACAVCSGTDHVTADCWAGTANKLGLTFGPDEPGGTP